jgi:hypothetical protein
VCDATVIRSGLAAAPGVLAGGGWVGCRAGVPVAVRAGVTVSGPGFRT